MTHYEFTLPRSFQPAEFLPGRLMLHADAARWLVSMILRKTANRDVDPWGCVRLDSTILRRVMGNFSADIARALERGGAIETASYRAGVRCKGYRLARRYLGDRCVQVPCVDPRLVARLDAERRRLDAQDTRSGWLPIHYALDAEERALSIDATAAEAILAGLPAHTRLCQDVLVGDLRRRDFRFSVGSTGRVFNALTGLKRELRAALRIGGEAVGGVDIRNAQPALLALEMDLNTPAGGWKDRATYKHKHTRRSLPLPSPAVPSPVLPLPCPLPSPDFAFLASHGRLYEFLAGATGLNRNTVKLAFLRDVLAKRGHYPSKVEQMFRREFPSVYQFIRAINREDHGELIRRLQRLESWLVVETVAPRLVGRVPILTLHDSLYSTRCCLAAVEEAFNEVFDAIGFRLALKREVPDDSTVDRHPGRCPVANIQESENTPALSMAVESNGVR